MSRNWQEDSAPARPGLSPIQRHSERHSSPRLCAPHLSPQERNKTFQATRPGPQHPPPTCSCPSRSPGSEAKTQPGEWQPAAGGHRGSSRRTPGGTPPGFRGLGQPAWDPRALHAEPRGRGLGGRGAEGRTWMPSTESAWDGAPPRAGGRGL